MSIQTDAAVAAHELRIAALEAEVRALRAERLTPEPQQFVQLRHAVPVEMTMRQQQQGNPSEPKARKGVLRKVQA